MTSFNISLEDIKNLHNCSVCLTVPRSGHIFQCDNGHLHCSSCHQKLKNKICPVCRIRLRESRNLVAEQTIEKYLYVLTRTTLTQTNWYLLYFSFFKYFFLLFITGYHSSVNLKNAMLNYSSLKLMSMKKTATFVWFNVSFLILAKKKCHLTQFNLILISVHNLHMIIISILNIMKIAMNLRLMKNVLINLNILLPLWKHTNIIFMLKLSVPLKVTHHQRDYGIFGYIFLDPKERLNFGVILELKILEMMRWIEINLFSYYQFNCDFPCKLSCRKL